MNKRLEVLMWTLAGASIFAVAATDPWWVDNWLRIGIVALIVLCAATVAFLAGVSHGIRIGRGEIQWKL